jgi:hypothetical protein
MYAKVHCHVTKKVTFADVAMTFFLPHQQKVNREGYNKIRQHYKGVFPKK